MFCDKCIPRSEQLEVRTQANQVKPMPSEEMKTEEGLKEVEDKHAGSLCVICCQNFASDEDGKRRKIGKPVIYDPAAKENHQLKRSRARAHSISAQVPSECVTY